MSFPAPVYSGYKPPFMRSADECSALMKMQITLLTLSLTLCGLSAANSIRFTERLNDVRVCTTDEGETFCDAVTRDSGSITGRLTIAGLRDLVIDADTTVEMGLGGASWSFAWGEGRNYTSNRTTFILGDFDENDDFIVRGSLIFSRRGDVLTIAGATRRLESSFAAEGGGWDENGRGSVDFFVDIGGIRVDRTLYFKAVATERPSPPVDGEPGEPLVNVVVNGSADFTKPTVVINTPRNRSRTTNEAVTVTGTAKDRIAVTQVLWRLGSNDWFEADAPTSFSPATSWSAIVDLAVGTNSFQVKSVDQEGQESRVARRTIIRKP